jgi:CRP-like cAMP-binding protein
VLSFSSFAQPRPGRSSGNVQNGLLRALPASALAQLMPLLERVPMRRRQVLHERNLPLSHGYFVERGLASLQARAGDVCAVEVGTLGKGDFSGLPLVLGTMRTPHRCVVQVAGEALRIGGNELRQALADIPALRQILLAYAQASAVQSSQLVVCNTRHAMYQRLARWLLFAQDQVGAQEIPLTHQFLARALGVRRAGVTTAMGRMEHAGLIRRGRGRLAILDRARLEAEACECYRAIRSEHGRIGCDDPVSSQVFLRR